MPKLRNQVTATAGTSAPTGIALSQSLVAAGPLTLNGASASGGVATLSPPQNVVIASAGNDSTLVWTISGTDYGGSPISETLAGANAGNATSALLYATVTSIVGSKAAAGTVEAGVGGSVYSPWLILGAQRNHYQFRLRALLSTQTGTFVIQGTSDQNIMNNTGGYADDIETIQASGSTGIDLPEVAPWMAVRLQVTVGTVTLRAIESRTA